MIYLAIHGRVFGPFEERELTRATLSDYRWIYREDRAHEGWQPIDAAPRDFPRPTQSKPEAVLSTPEHPIAVAGTLESVRARGGWLHSTEDTIRLAVGTPVRLDVMASTLGNTLRTLPARIERVEAGIRDGIATVRYRLAWDPLYAP